MDNQSLQTANMKYQKGAQCQFLMLKMWLRGDFMMYVIIQSCELDHAPCAHTDASFAMKVPQGPLLTHGSPCLCRTIAHAQVTKASQGTDHDGCEPTRCHATCHRSCPCPVSPCLSSHLLKWMAAYGHKKCVESGCPYGLGMHTGCTVIEMLHVGEKDSSCLCHGVFIERMASALQICGSRQNLPSWKL